MSDLLSDEEIDARLPDGWHRDGDQIVRTFEFDSYLEGVGFCAPRFYRRYCVLTLVFTSGTTSGGAR